MSEFKFSCPACGQHLAGDLGYAGRQILCPTCQQTITVPSPAMAAAPALAPSVAPPPPPPPPSAPTSVRPAISRPAAAAASRPSPTPRPAPVTMAPPSRAASKTSGLAVASLICSCATLLAGPFGAIPGVICGHLARRQMRRDPSLGGRGLATAGLVVGYSLLAVSVLVIGLTVSAFVKAVNEGMRQAAQPAGGGRVRVERPTPRSSVTRDTAPDGSGWTLQLDGVAIPAQPARGRMHGRPFAPETVTLENGRLRFRQGRDFFPDLELSVVLFEEDLNRLAGRTFAVPGSRGTRPHVWLSWKEPGQGSLQQKSFVDGYALRLELGQLTDGKLPGKIYVCVPDEEKSFLRGTFEMGGKPPTTRPGGDTPRPRPAGGRPRPGAVQ